MFPPGTSVAVRAPTQSIEKKITLWYKEDKETAMSNKIKQILENIPSELTQYSEIRDLVKQGKSQEALQKLEASTLNSSTKEQLKKALQSGESYVIDRVFSELDARLANALCWECWRD